MAQILLAWELGTGLGHVGRLAPIARELARRGHSVTLSVLDLIGTRSLVRDLPFPCLQAPVALQGRSSSVPAMSLAEVLADCGYRDADVLAALVRGWRSTLTCVKADALVADFAPTALLAARTLGIPSASTGLGFSMPPVGKPLPSFRPWERLEPGRLADAEAGVVEIANRVLVGLGSPPLAHGWELFSGRRSLVCDWPELDCYARASLPDGERWYGRGFDPSAGEAAAWPAGTGPRVFAYLKGSHSDVAAVLRALAARGCRTLCYLSDIAPGKPRPFEHASIRYSAGPVNLASTLPECDLVLCHAGGGTIAQALLAGVPLLLLPLQNEQGLNAICVARLGAGIGVFPDPRPFDYAAALVKLLDQGAARTAARKFAAAHPDFSNERQVRDMCDAIESMTPPSDLRAPGESPRVLERD